MDVVKAEKDKAMLRYRRLRRAASLSRCLLEALAALSLLSWSSARLPAALALCAGLRHLPALLLHPLSAFLVGNAIIVALVAKSSEVSVAAAAAAAADPHPPLPSSLSSAAGPSPSAAYDQHRYQGENGKTYAVYEDKAVCLEGTTTAAPAAVSVASYYATTKMRAKKERPEGPRFRRTRSGDVDRVVTEEAGEEKQLRRSQSEAGTGAEGKVIEWLEEEEVADDGDNEEFRQKIEAFIARQLRFIEREEKSLLLATTAVSTAGGSHNYNCRR